jgi:hypothetical protein
MSTHDYRPPYRHDDGHHGLPSLFAGSEHHHTSCGFSSRPSQDYDRLHHNHHDLPGRFLWQQYQQQQQQQQRLGQTRPVGHGHGTRVRQAISATTDVIVLVLVPPMVEDHHGPFKEQEHTRTWTSYCTSPCDPTLDANDTNAHCIYHAHTITTTTTTKNKKCTANTTHRRNNHHYHHRTIAIATSPPCVLLHTFMLLPLSLIVRTPHYN